MSKQKIVLLDEKEQTQRIRKAIIRFIEDKWLTGSEVIQSDVLSEFKKPPFSLSSGTIRKYIDELIDAHKIQSWYKSGKRYYGPPKMSTALKTGIVIAAIIICSGVIIDVLCPPEIIYNSIYLYADEGFDVNNTKITTLPFIVFGIVITSIMTAFSYVNERKLYK